MKIVEMKSALTIFSTTLKRKMPLQSAWIEVSITFTEINKVCAESNHIRTVCHNFKTA